MIELVTLAAILVAVELFLRGWRGTPVLSSPRCGRCGYDLRWVNPETQPNCPECGQDLQAPGTVDFGKWRRRPRLMIAAGCLAFVPLAFVAGNVVMGLLGYRWSDMRSNRQIAAKLASTADQPWDWQVLEKRYRAGTLSNGEAGQAIDQLITFLSAKPGGYRQPLPWADSFFRMADAKGAISDEQFGRLAAAFYGPAPLIAARDRISAGDRLDFQVKYGDAWNLPGLNLVKAVRRVTLGGQECPVFTEYQPRKPAQPDELSNTGVWPITGSLIATVPPGRHEVAFEIDIGLMPAVNGGTGGKPGQARRWKQARYRWSKTVACPLEVLPAGTATVTPVTDASLDPSDALKVKAVATFGSAGKSTITIHITSAGMRVPGAFFVQVAVGPTKTPAGNCFLDAARQQMRVAVEVPTPGPEVTSVTVSLDPDLRAAERQPGVRQTWGKPIVFASVPLDRQDLEEETK
jgi:hypothetical protein